MSFDLSTPMKDTSFTLDEVEINTSSWLRNKNVASVLVIKTGAMYMQRNLNAEQALQLIENLHQHIANIKECELELIALQTKVAA